MGLPNAHLSDLYHSGSSVCIYKGAAKLNLLLFHFYGTFIRSVQKCQTLLSWINSAGQYLLLLKTGRRLSCPTILFFSLSFHIFPVAAALVSALCSLEIQKDTFPTEGNTCKVTTVEESQVWLRLLSLPSSLCCWGCAQRLLPNLIWF